MKIYRAVLEIRDDDPPLKRETILRILTRASCAGLEVIPIELTEVTDEVRNTADAKG